MKRLIGFLLTAAMAVSATIGSVTTAFAAPVQDEAAAAAEVQSAVAAEDYPKVNLLENREDSVKIGWTKYPGAAKYRVFIKEGNTWKGLGNSEYLSYIHKISGNNKSFVYTVRAIGKDGKFMSSYCKEGYAHKFVSTPSITSIENVDGAAKLTWPAKKGVIYRVFYLDSKGVWRKLAKLTTNEYYHKKAQNGEDWTYPIRYENSKGQFISPYNSRGWKNRYIATPQISSITRDKNVFVIKWNKNPYIEKYRVYRKQGSDSWQRLGDTTATSYNDSKMVSGVKFTYMIRAINAQATKFTSALSKQKWKICVMGNMSEKTRKLREGLIDFLSKQVGNNNRKYIDHINKYGHFGLGYGTQWCAVFGWGAMDMYSRTQSNVTNLIPPRWHVSEIANEARKLGGWYNTFSSTYEAKPGDIFMTSFYKYPYEDGRTHVGYIEYVDKDKNGKVTYIHTIEGNFNWEIGDNSQTRVGRWSWKDRLEKDHGAMVTDYLDISKILKVK